MQPLCQAKSEAAAGDVLQRLLREQLPDTPDGQRLQLELPFDEPARKPVRGSE